MSFELPSENVEELTALENLDPEKILENPEAIFSGTALSPEREKEARQFHDSIVARPELLIGSGNDAVVFDYPIPTKEPLCLKNIWEDISVEMKGKKFWLLPPKLRELRKIQEYFERVKEKRRERIARGQDYIPSNTPKAEAGYQTAARLFLEREGIKGAVPQVKSLIRIGSKGGSEVDGLPFVFDETADIMTMDKVPGKSVQDFILNYDRYEEVLAKLDPDRYREELRRIMQVLHDGHLSHQDVTKRNIMLDFERMAPVVIDFGKASHGFSHFTADDEMGHVEEVCRALKSLKANPEKARTDLRRNLKLDFS